MLIIYPHWPPSNLVGVHRVRLIANELHALGWKPTVLCIDERDYEESLAHDTEQLVQSEVEVVKVRAIEPIHILGKRMLGDIGLRGWIPLKKKAKELLGSNRFDFIWFSMPSWYPSLMGYSLSSRYKVPFGIDYQDPWIHEIPNHHIGLNRATLTIQLAKILEPLALRGASLISGISEGYLAGVKNRYSRLRSTPFVCAQLGFSPRDHQIELSTFQLPFQKGKRTYVYAGAHWAMGAPLFSMFLQALERLKHRNELPTDVHFLFIGTGNPELPSLTEQISSMGLSDFVSEIPERLSYLEVQQILRSSDGAMIIGSVQPHYSASKVFQCLLTAPRLLGFFHKDSEAASILRICNAHAFFAPYDSDSEAEFNLSQIENTLVKFIDPGEPWNPDLSKLDSFSACASASKLVEAIESILHPTQP